MTDSPLVLRAAEIDQVDRGAGIRTSPLVGPWNATANEVTSGITTFAPDAGAPLHTHNVEELVLILAGEARAVVGDGESDLAAGDAVWVPAGVPHRFANRGAGELRFHWVYAGREVTRTICATGETVAHLSAADRLA